MMPDDIDRAFPVVEIFGPTIQGEGPDVGTPCHFVRFGGCDYRCGYAKNERGRWESEPTGNFVCDSLHAVLPEEVRKARRLTTTQILDELAKLHGDPRYVVLSGGNPAMHELGMLVTELHIADWRVSIETQGSLWKPWMSALDTVVVSPKPPASRQAFSFEALSRFLKSASAKSALEHRRPLLTSRPKLALKVPIFDDKDLAFADSIKLRYPTIPMFLSITNDWQKPNTREELLERYAWVAKTAQEYPNLTTAPVLPQLHVLVYGNDRGR